MKIKKMLSKKLLPLKKYILLFTLVFLVAVSCHQANKTEGSPYQKSEVPGSDFQNPDNLESAIDSLMKKHNVPGVSIALMKKGKVLPPKNYGIIQEGKTDKIDDQTVFSVGSVSKVANALIVLKLVDEGKLSLNENVNKYLKSWKVPPNEFTKNNPITLRHILSHTAGFSVHGFADYNPGEKIPTSLQILNGEKPAKSAKVKVIFAPGSRFKYSGGGTTVAQQIIMDVTGMPYEKGGGKDLI